MISTSSLFVCQYTQYTIHLDYNKKTIYISPRFYQKESGPIYRKESGLFFSVSVMMRTICARHLPTNKNHYLHRHHFFYMLYIFIFLNISSLFFFLSNRPPMYFVFGYFRVLPSPCGLQKRHTSSCNYG